MSGLREKRDYYPDRSLKSVYFVDEHGQKQAKYTEYEQNSTKIKKELEYKDNAVWNGRVETEDGYIIYNDGEKSKEVKTTTHRNGSKRDFPFGDYVETETIENGESIKEKEFTYEEVFSESRFNRHTHTIKRISSVQDGVTIDQVIKYDSKTPGFDIDGWKNKEEWRMTFHNGVLVEYSEPCGNHVHYENGIPTGDYQMPLCDDTPKYDNNGRIPRSYLKASYSTFRPSFPVPTGDKLIDNLPVLNVLTDLKEFSQDIIKEIYVNPIITGTWKDGKFTGKAEGGGFSAEWTDGKVNAHLHIRSGPKYQKEYHWRENICEVKCRDHDIVEKYTLRNGLKHGLYTREPYGYDRRTEKEESEYKDGKLHGMSRKYNVKGWLESETQYQDGKKHGFEKLYNSDRTVASIKYYQNGQDCTAKYNRLKKIASKHIEEEDKLSEGKNERVVLKRKTKLGKAIDVAAEAIKDKLHAR